MINPNIPFHKPSIDTEEEAAVLEVLRSGWLTTGEKSIEFEKVFADFVGAKYALAVSSATAGLFLSLRALGIGKNDNVYTTPYTFISTAEVIEWCGAKPYFVDIDENTFDIDPANLKNIPDGSTILPVHIAGIKCNMEKIYRSANAIRIIDDSAHFFPSKFDGRSVTSVFSFYATKSITTGEGGMVVTNNDYIADKIKSLRYHGIKNTTWDRYTSIKNKWYYEVHELGYKYNLADIPSALGIVQLKKANRMLDNRWRIATKYQANLSKFDFIKTPVIQYDNTWHLYIIRLVLDNLKIDRDEFIRQLSNKGIGVSVHFIPLHKMPYFASRKLDFPIADKVYSSVISLPIFPDMIDEQIEKVIQSIKEIGEIYHK